MQETKTLLKNDDVPTQTYSHTSDNDKYYFASFLNDADHNFDQIVDMMLNLINCKLDINADFGVKVKKIFPLNLTASEWGYRFSKLKEYFPAASFLFIELNYDTEKKDTEKKMSLKSQIKLLTKRMSLLRSTLKNFRNFHTHKIHDAILIETEIDFWLNQVFLFTVKDVMQLRFSSENGKLCLPERFQELQEIKDPKQLEQVLSSSFSHLVKKESEMNGKVKWELKNEAIYSHEQGLSSIGFIFFMSLFLAKKDMEELMDHVKGFKDTSEIHFQATRWVCSFNCIKRIKKVLRSDYNDNAFALQIVDELSKCPTPLFNHLKETYKKEFIEDLNEYVQEPRNGIQSLNNSTVSHLVIRKRFEDKFPYFALRFLDEQLNFENLKFQVFLGLYVHDRTEKTLNYTDYKTERVIKEPVKIFAKLSEIQKIKKDYFDSDPEIQENGWDKYPGAHYAIRNNKIAIHHAKFNSKEYSNTERKKRKTKQALFSEYKNNAAFRKIKISEPTAYLSIHELPAMVHYFIKRKSEGTTNEKISKEIECQIINKLNDNYLSKETLEKKIDLEDKKSLPKKIYKLEVEKEPEGIQFGKLKRDLEKEVDSTTKWLDTLKEEDKNGRIVNKKWLSNKERGELATWLTNDIKRFLSKEIRKSWKSIHSRELQSMLASYSLCKKQIRLLLSKDIGVNIKKNEDHPFLKTALYSEDLIGFSETYLKGRNFYLKKNLESEIERLKSLPNMGLPKRKHKKEIKDSFLWTYFSKRKYIWCINDEYLSHLRRSPVNLPRGLFDESPTFKLNANQEFKKAEWFTFSEEPLENLQEYYSYPRTYFLGNHNSLSLEIDPKISSIKSQIHYEQIDSKLKGAMYSNEGTIRKIKRQDLLLSKILEYLLKDQLGTDYRIQLKDCFMNRSQKAIHRLESNQQHQRLKGDTSENIIYEGHLWSKRIKTSIHNGRITGEFALKEAGKMYKLLNDPRVEQILKYDENKWNYEALIEELEAYAKNRRVFFFKLIHKLEESIYNSTAPKDKGELKSNQNHNFRRYISHYLYKKGNITIDEKEEINNNKGTNIKNSNIVLQDGLLLIYLRNKIAHNQYPVKEVIDLIKESYVSDDHGVKKYADYIMKTIEIITGKFDKL